jgi:hypothetical protein
MKQYTYSISAVVRDMLCTDEVQAVSDKQAWYFFSKKYGFKHRDFKILNKTEVPQHTEQLSFNI